MDVRLPYVNEFSVLGRALIRSDNVQCVPERKVYYSLRTKVRLEQVAVVPLVVLRCCLAIVASLSGDLVSAVPVLEH